MFIYFIKGVMVWVESIKPLKAFFRDTRLFIRCQGGGEEGAWGSNKKSCLQQEPVFSIGGVGATCHANIFTRGQCRGSMEAITGWSHLVPGGKKSKPCSIVKYD